MTPIESPFEKQLSAWIAAQPTADSAHDPEHIRRVVTNARALLAHHPEADAEIVIAAAWLHDCVAVAKDSPHRKQASALAAKAATEYLQTTHFPAHKCAAVAHAIEAHSFSASIEPKTLEAQIVQDADRLDALGAIGMARCFAVSGGLNRPLYNPVDPFCEHRAPNDADFALDHFFAKLFRIIDTLRTPAGRAEGQRRRAAMEHYLQALRREIMN